MESDSVGIHCVEASHMLLHRVDVVASSFRLHNDKIAATLVRVRFDPLFFVVQSCFPLVDYGAAPSMPNEKKIVVGLFVCPNKWGTLRE